MFKTSFFSNKQLKVLPQWQSLLLTSFFRLTWPKYNFQNLKGKCVFASYSF